MTKWQSVAIQVEDKNHIILMRKLGTDYTAHSQPYHEGMSGLRAKVKLKIGLIANAIKLNLLYKNGEGYYD